MNFLGIKLAECGHFMIYLPVKVVLEAIARHSQGEDLGRLGKTRAGTGKSGGNLRHGANQFSKGSVRKWGSGIHMKGAGRKDYFKHLKLILKAWLERQRSLQHHVDKQDLVDEFVEVCGTVEDGACLHWNSTQNFLLETEQTRTNWHPASRTSRLSRIMWMPNLLIGHIDVENENQLFVGHFPGETHGNHVFFLYASMFSAGKWCNHRNWSKYVVRWLNIYIIYRYLHDEWII